LATSSATYEIGTTPHDRVAEYEVTTGRWKRKDSAESFDKTISNEPGGKLIVWFSQRVERENGGGKAGAGAGRVYRTVMTS
jgi:hypothetical protein